MTARIEVRLIVECEGEGCKTDAMTARPGVIKFRKRLAATGWTRRHASNIQVDLCPTCSKAWVTPPDATSGGRPRKNA